MDIKTIGEVYEEIKKELETETDPQKKEELNRELNYLLETAKKELLRAEQAKQRDVFHRNYTRLEKIFGCDLSTVKRKQYLKLTAKPYMDLHVDILSRTETSFVLSMAHNYQQNGDAVPDPDMEIEIDLENKTAEALTFQNSLIYSVVYDFDIHGVKIRVRPAVKKSLNSFLEMWTKNIIEQGHKIDKTKEAE